MQIIIAGIILILLLYYIGWTGIIIFTAALITAVIIANKIKKDKLALAYENSRRHAKLVANLAATTSERIINQHLKELSLKKQQLVIKDSYNTFNTKQWEQEKRYFIKNVIGPNLNTSISTTQEDGISKYIDKLANDYQLATENHPKKGFSNECTPIEYEQQCANILIQKGWDAKTTVATGDQGADVIAEKYGKKAIIQCKKYSRPVGNKAIQEAHAAKGFYNAHYAIVVTNASFTTSAKQLANKLGVVLLHHSELEDLAKKLSI